MEWKEHAEHECHHKRKKPCRKERLAFSKPAAPSAHGPRTQIHYEQADPTHPRLYCVSRRGRY